MKDRQFVDTNILIYAYDVSAGEKHHRARTLLEELWLTGNGCLSTQVLQEFYINVTRKIPKPLHPQEASQIIASYQVWPVYAITISDIVKSISIQQEISLSFWDALIVCAAIDLNSSLLWSEDLNAGQTYYGVKVLCPW